MNRISSVFSNVYYIPPKTEEDENEEQPKPSQILGNMISPDIIENQVNDEGIIERYDIDGNNKNTTSFKTKPKIEKKINIDHGYKPGERLLLSIQKEKPELLLKSGSNKHIRLKKITTKLLP